MKPKWAQQKVNHEEAVNVFSPVIPPVQEVTGFSLECIDGQHKAELLHKGTAYCRSCYDERNRQGRLIH